MKRCVQISTPPKVNVRLTTTPDSHMQCYSQRYLAFPIVSSRLNPRNTPGPVHVVAD